MKSKDLNFIRHFLLQQVNEVKQSYGLKAHELELLIIDLLNTIRMECELEMAIENEQLTIELNKSKENEEDAGDIQSGVIE